MSKDLKVFCHCCGKVVSAALWDAGWDLCKPCVACAENHTTGVCERPHCCHGGCRS